MLKHLSIKHYALIETLEIEFDKGLNILTGETGSGKSIILGALGLLIGERADIRVVADGKKKCIVEGNFALSQARFEPIFEAYNLDFEPETYIRREIVASGKSRAFVNDTPINLNVLKVLGAHLLDIHSQHQTMQINETGFQFEVLDRNAGNAEELKAYRYSFAKWGSESKKLADLQVTEKESRNEHEFVAFQLKELEAADLKDIDSEALEEEYNTLAHAEEIAEGLNGVRSALSENENAILSNLRLAKERINKLIDYGKSFANIAERLSSSLIELDDISREVENLADVIELDPTRLERLEAKRSTLFRLEQKHLVDGVEALIQKQHALKARFDEVDNLTERIAEQEKIVRSERVLLDQAGKSLRLKRQESLPKFSAKIEKVLKSLNMKAARFEVQLSPLDAPSKLGLDAIQIRFSANAGRKLESLKQVASGGELSRLMLAIKTIAASKSERKTLFFDEIDTGVSGEVANAMGIIIRDMARETQVICITHLPQIASKGEAHFKVFKQRVNGVEKSDIERLSSDERIAEIAQMLSGANTTQAALDNARELLLNH